jgi:hypothetical protein
MVMSMTDSEEPNVMGLFISRLEPTRKIDLMENEAPKCT